LVFLIPPILEILIGVGFESPSKDGRLALVSRNRSVSGVWAPSAHRLTQIIDVISEQVMGKMKIADIVGVLQKAAIDMQAFAGRNDDLNLPGITYSPSQRRNELRITFGSDAVEVSSPTCSLGEIPSWKTVLPGLRECVR